jgi:hypothetical protein
MRRRPFHVAHCGRPGDLGARSWRQRRQQLEWSWLHHQREQCSRNTLWCNGVPEPDLDGVLEINGSGSSESSIRDAVVRILLRGVSSSSSLRISCPEVTPLFDETTQFGGIFCEDESNVTLAAIAGGVEWCQDHI